MKATRFNHGQPIQRIEDPAALEGLCQQLAGSPWLTLDTEFMRERTYYTELCLIQIANADIVACIDPIRLCEVAPNGLQDIATVLLPLKHLLFAPDCIKVLHAAHQDMEIFFNLWGELPAPVFDTQIAATLAGQPDQVGYGNLVASITGKRLDKGQSRTDWKHRPLSEAQIQYAANDVTWLREVYVALQAQLEDKGRLAWLKADFARLSEADSYRLDDRLRWRKVKGHDRLRPAQLGVLRSLAAWRETQAREANRPRQWILKDANLLDLARLIPRDHSALARLRGLPEQTIRRHGDTLLRLVSEGSRDPVQAEAQDMAKPTAEQQLVLDVLSAAVSIIAQQTGISAGTLATRKQLIAWLSEPSASRINQGWRGELLGSTLEALVEHRLAIEIQDGVASFRSLE